VISIIADRNEKNKKDRIAAGWKIRPPEFLKPNGQGKSPFSPWQNLSWMSQNSI